MDNKNKNAITILNRQQLNYLKENNFILTEEDFYPPSDDRVLKSRVYDIYGGDNFADYCEYIFDLYEEEDYWEN